MRAPPPNARACRATTAIARRTIEHGATNTIHRRPFHARMGGVCGAAEGMEDRGRGRCADAAALARLSLVHQGADGKGAAESRDRVCTPFGAGRPSQASEGLGEHRLAPRGIPRLCRLHGIRAVLVGGRPAHLGGARRAHRDHVRRSSLVALSSPAHCRCADHSWHRGQTYRYDGGGSCLPNGESCSTGDDCCSAWCDLGGECSDACMPDGESGCLYDEDCCSGDCFAGDCVAAE